MSNYLAISWREQVTFNAIMVRSSFLLTNILLGSLYCQQLSAANTNIIVFWFEVTGA